MDTPTETRSALAADSRALADLIIAAETCRDDSQKGVSFHRDNMRARDALLRRVMTEHGIDAWNVVVEGARPLVAAALRG
jgi:hypothetical protein